MHRFRAALNLQARSDVRWNTHPKIWRLQLQQISHQRRQCCSPCWRSDSSGPELPPSSLSEVTWDQFVDGRRELKCKSLFLRHVNSPVFRRAIWSFWLSIRKPGMCFANSTTYCTASVSRMAQCCHISSTDYKWEQGRKKRVVVNAFHLSIIQSSFHNI